MHMADALLSPIVGTAFWAASGSTLVWCSRRLRNDTRDHLVPLMGVLGAFIFAAQMINFSIPATGSSGHIGGGLLLSIVVGGPAAFVVITSVLTVQALFFADGGLLALGANIFNLGFFPCFIAYPLIYLPLLRGAGNAPSRRRLTAVTCFAAIIGLQLGAVGVVSGTQLSGVSSLPLGAFLSLMLPIHFAIGFVEGLATVAIVEFIHEAQPDLVDGGLSMSNSSHPTGLFPTRIIAMLACAALVTGGMLSWFASSNPDGLEWSIEQVTGKPEITESTSIHHGLAQLQHQLASMPDYNFSPSDKPDPAAASKTDPQQAWPAVDAGSSFAGVIGGLVTLILVMGIGYLLRPRRTRQSQSA
jgi:cobalt/nickel transport system permease protein